jgi:hypothetical protein
MCSVQVGEPVISAVSTRFKVVNFPSITVAVAFVIDGTMT